MNTKRTTLLSPGFRGETTVDVISQVYPHPQAEFAMRLMEHLAIATATPDGEDSAGRSRMRLLTAHEIVQRACAIAAVAYEEFEGRDWLLSLPLPTPPPPYHE